MSRPQDGDATRHYRDSREYSNERKGHYHRSHYASDLCEDRPRKRFKEEHADSKREAYYEGYEGRHGHRRSHSRSDHSEYYRGHRSEHSKDVKAAKEPSPSRKSETPSEYNKTYGTGKVSEATTKETLVSSTPAQKPMADTTKMSVDNPEPSAFNKEELQESPLTELLANLRKTVETPLEVAARAVEQLPEAPSMRHSLLLAIVRVKQGSLGRTPHAEHWKKDVKWMKQELSSLVALDRQRLERRRQEVLREEGRGPGELKVVPKVRYWGKSCYADETRVITRRLRQMAEEDGKAELEIAQRERHLAEMKLQMAKTELKAKLIDLKIAKRLT
eukprot:TRINITY_DN1378_c0_g1_i5.p1 TRINITY_DN1378_c0_g1~~TRINITY_DN1378_c0_g1_i5.p1  ORF type:complete len:332 (+),score=72.47 TRINITY_DN1378_c0_g1_i5:60-1055(+)